MRRDKFLSFLFAAGLGAVIAYASVSCMISAFRLEFNAGSGGLLLFSLICGALSAGLFSLRRGGWILLGLGLLMLLLRLEDILYGWEILLHRLTSLYNGAYGWTILQWSNKPLVNVPADGALLTLAALISTAAAWVICHRRKVLWALIPAFLPLAACMIVTDTVPGETPLFWLVFGCFLLILTQSTRRRSAPEGNRLTAILLIPCLLLSSLLFFVAPRESYEANGNPLQNAILHWLQQLPFAPEHNGPGNITGTLSGDTVDLSNIGKNDTNAQTIMRVTGAQTGLLYLRGQAFDEYTGEAWRVSGLEVSDLGWGNRDGTLVATIRIETEDVHPQLYFPYYADTSTLRVSLLHGKLDNTQGIKSYAFQQYDKSFTNSTSLHPPMEQQCLELPSDTREGAEKILQTLLGSSQQSIMKQAEAIEAYVSNLARYDLNTDKMPGGEKDFALWFLEDAESGYCVHYATAAVVLLRAAGIPARYVTGYIGYASENTVTTIIGDNAHAWVEYYIPGTFGWRIMEVTPSAGLPQHPNGPDAPNPTSPTETTSPTSAPTTAPTVSSTTGNPATTDPYLPTPTVGPERPTSNTTAVKPTARPETPAPPTSQLPLWLLAIPGSLGGFALLLWLQFYLRCRLRRKRMRDGNRKQRLLVRWKYTLRLCRVLKTLPPPELLELAEKAAFSQHPSEDLELKQFDRWIREAEHAVRKESFALLRRLIWAIE